MLRAASSRPEDGSGVPRRAPARSRTARTSSGGFDSFRPPLLWVLDQRSLRRYLDCGGGVKGKRVCRAASGHRPLARLVSSAHGRSRSCPHVATLAPDARCAAAAAGGVKPINRLGRQHLTPLNSRRDPGRKRPRGESSRSRVFDDAAGSLEVPPHLDPRRRERRIRSSK